MSISSCEPIISFLLVIKTTHIESSESRTFSSSPPKVVLAVHRHDQHSNWAPERSISARNPPPPKIGTSPSYPTRLELDKKGHDNFLETAIILYFPRDSVPSHSNEFLSSHSTPNLHLRPSRLLSSPPHSATNTCIYNPPIEKHTALSQISHSKILFQYGPHPAHRRGTIPGPPTTNVRWRE